jgi:thioredoxin 1
VQKAAVDKKRLVKRNGCTMGIIQAGGVLIVIRLRKPTILQLLLSLALLLGPPAVIADVGKFNDVPVKGMVTMIDLGATECIPCKLMVPIMEKMKKLYDGKAVIVFINVWKHKEQARRFSIRAIPTQIFFNENGKEVYRHIGFMSEKAIVNQLRKMGVE